MSLELEMPLLDLDEGEAQHRFASLQQKLVAMWETIDNLDERAAEQTIIVVPSMTVDMEFLQGSILQAYEERFLFLLLLLRQPNAHLIYASSLPINPDVIDYYLGMLPGVIASHARRRLHLVTPCDGASQPLSIKLLQRPRLLQRIRHLIPNRDRAHLIAFNVTRHERDLALCLGVPLFGAEPRHAELGSKTGCRTLFTETNVPHPSGYEGLTSEVDVIDALADLRRRVPQMQDAIVKQNDGVSGEGNAVVDLTNVEAGDRETIVQRLQAMDISAAGIDYEKFMTRFAEVGGIVEQRVGGDIVASPSVQLRITPLGEVELLSTHDQLLGGEDQQKFLGCIFPASDDYASMICEDSLRVGQRLAEHGVLGRFAVDFLCVRSSDGWERYAIELNLRKGGTTHPFLTLQFLTDGHYDAANNRFRIGDSEKHYVASDAVSSESFRAFTHEDLFDVMMRHDLQYDHTRQKGVVLHMMSAVGDHGRFGLTAIANSRDEAKQLYDHTLEVFAREAEQALDKSLKLPE